MYNVSDTKAVPLDVFCSRIENAFYTVRWKARRLMVTQVGNARCLEESAICYISESSSVLKKFRIHAISPDVLKGGFS